MFEMIWLWFAVKGSDDLVDEAVMVVFKSVTYHERVLRVRKNETEVRHTKEKEPFAYCEECITGRK